MVKTSAMLDAAPMKNHMRMLSSDAKLSLFSFAIHSNDDATKIPIAGKMLKCHFQTGSSVDSFFIISNVELWHPSLRA